jgi:hypothetical protein
MEANKIFQKNIELEIEHRLTWNSQLEDKCTVLKSEDGRTLHKSVLCQKIKALYPSQKTNVHYPSQSEDKWTVSQSDDERKLPKSVRR